MTEISVCPKCGGESADHEVQTVEYMDKYAVAGQIARMCSDCGEFLGQICSDCGGWVVWEWAGPGQAFWKCLSCGDLDIAWHNPPRPHRWVCIVCSVRYWSFSPPSENPICGHCLEAASDARACPPSNLE